jgi:hypothetical protein
MSRQSDTEKCTHGPGFNYTNLSIKKDIHFASENSRQVQLRQEGFNVFSHANKDRQTKSKTSRLDQILQYPRQFLQNFITPCQESKPQNKQGIYLQGLNSSS